FLDQGVGHGGYPTGRAPAARSIPVAHCNKQIPLRQSRPGARSVCRIGRTETAQAVGEATLAFLPQTSPPPGAWSYHECECLPSAPPNDPGKPVLHPDSQTEALSVVFAECVPLPIQLCPCDSDRGPDTASPPLHSGPADHDRAD